MGKQVEPYRPYSPVTLGGICRSASRPLIGGGAALVVVSVVASAAWNGALAGVPDVTSNTPLGALLSVSSPILAAGNSVGSILLAVGIVAAVLARAVTAMTEPPRTPVPDDWPDDPDGDPDDDPRTERLDVG